MTTIRRAATPWLALAASAVSVWAVSPMIQRRSSSESQDRAVWPSCTWPMYPPARDEEVGAPHDAGA